MLAFLVAGVSYLSAAAPALAGLEFCNKTREKIWLAVASHQQEWVSQGWWAMEPGTCAEPIKGNLETSYYYYYAESGGIAWNAGAAEGYYFCAPRAVFRDAPQDSCPKSEQELFQEVVVGDALSYRLELTDPSEAATALLEERCLISWDDSHQLHSSEVIIELDYQAVKTTMKKLRHCVMLRVTGPVSLDGVATQFIEQCADYALNHDKARHIIEGIIALGVEIFGEGTTGGAVVGAKVLDYLNSVRNNFTSCMTDTDQVQDRLTHILAAEIDAVVRLETHWIYWDL